MSDTWLKMTAADLGRAIGDGQIDPRALTDAFLDAIDTHPHSQRIYARTMPDRARAEADAASDRARAGLRRGLLDGVPISWKDLFDTAGVATESGSGLLAGRTPDADAEVLVNATAAGTVALGKTHMTELAFSGIGLNLVTQTSPNINDASLAPGGSSSGAATSVAWGLAAAGIGSDTGGSVRVPAAWNDLVGLKTSSGRLPNTGVVDLCPRFDTVGPLTRSVEDAAELLAVLGGGRAADLRGASLSGTRLLVLETLALDALEDTPAKGFEQAIAKLESAGATIERRKIPQVMQAEALSPVLYSTEAYAVWGETIEGNPDIMYPPTLERFRAGAGFSGVDYIRAWHELDRLRAQWLEALGGFDAVIAPTVAILPPSIERLSKDPEHFKERNMLTLRNTRIGNLMNAAGLTLPTGVPSTGIMFLAPSGGEERLLRLGAAAEAALR